MVIETPIWQPCIGHSAMKFFTAIARKSEKSRQRISHLTTRTYRCGRSNGTTSVGPTLQRTKLFSVRYTVFHTFNCPCNVQISAVIQILARAIKPVQYPQYIYTDGPKQRQIHPNQITFFALFCKLMW